MKKADIIMVAVVCILAAAIFIIMIQYHKRMMPGVVEVTCDGESIGSYSLNEDASIPIVTLYGTNQLLIQDGKASVVQADCGNGDCMRQGPIEKAGECIICMPHHLVITVQSEQSNEYDVIVQ